MNLHNAIAASILGSLAALAIAQTAVQTPTPAAAPAKMTAAAPAKTAPTARPAAKPVSQVDQVIELVKGGMSDAFVIAKLRKAAKPTDLSTAEVLKLKAAGVSENVMNVMMDPAAKSEPTPVAVVEPAVSGPAPAAAVAPTPAAVITVSLPSAPPPPAAPAATPNAQKKRVIVSPFDYSTVTTAVQNVFGTTQNIGNGIAAMLTTRLTKDGKVIIVERGKIDLLMSEQDRNKGNRVKQGTGARVGGVSGADALLAGDIIIFGRDDKKKGGSAAGTAFGAFCRYCGAVGGAAGGFKKEEKAVVAINYRFIDAETSEILASGEARGESKRTSNNWAAFGGAWGRGAGAAQVDMTSSNFAETIIGEATQDCVNKLAEIFATQADVMKKKPHEVEGMVADVNGNLVTINAGSGDGVNAGEVFEIFRVDGEVKDPVTHEVIDRRVTKVGDLTISNVRDRTSSGTYAGSAAASGFVARKKM